MKEEIKDLTVADLINRWLRIKSQQCRESTLNNYQNKISLYILPKLGEATINKLTVDRVQECFDDMKEYLNPTSIRLVFQIFKQFLIYLEEETITNGNICKKITIPPVNKKKVLALSYDQQKKLEKYLISENELPILLALDTGLRIGEVCGLMWKDIDLETNQIFVSRTTQRTRNTKANHFAKTNITTAKTKSESSVRIVPMTRRLHQALKKYPRKGLYIFTKNGMAPLDPRTLRYRLRRVQEDARLPLFNFHTLRQHLQHVVSKQAW